MNDAEIRLKVDVDGENATKSMSKLSDAGSKIGSAIVKGSAIAGTALIGLVGAAVSASGELEQQIGGTEAVFGEFASKVQDKSKEAFSTAGLSANEYMATINKMGALMQGSGVKQEKAMDLSSQAMQRAADVASIMGIDISVAMESVAGAAKGNFTMMDNLGVAMNVTALDSYALSKGIKKTYDEMSKGQQVELAMQMFLEKSSYAAGNYAKENETFAGSFTTLKASITNFLSGAGDIDSVIKSVVSFGKILLVKIKEMAPEVIKGIIELVKAIIPMIPELLKELLPTVLDGVMMLIQGIIDALPVLINMLAEMLPTILQSLITGLITIVNSLATMLPTLIPTIIKAILTMIPILLNNLPLFIDAGIQLIIGLTNGLIEAIPIIIEMLPQIIQSLITALLQAIPQLISIGPILLLALAKGLIIAIPLLIAKIPSIVDGMVNGFIEGTSKMSEVGENLIKGLWNGIKNVKDWLFKKIENFAGGILDKVKGIFGIHSPSKEFAIIGKYNVEGLEEGIESESKNLNKNLDMNMGSSLDYVAKMGMGKYNNSTSGINNQSIIFNVTTEAKVNEGVLFEAKQRIDYNKNLQTGFGG